MTKAYCAVMNEESMCVKEERKCDKPSLNLVANVVQLLHRYLATNDFLNKIGISSSPRCSLCDGVDESLEHFFVPCLFTYCFWADVIKWCSNRGVVINHLSA